MPKKPWFSGKHRAPPCPGIRLTAGPGGGAHQFQLLETVLTTTRQGDDTMKLHTIGTILLLVAGYSAYMRNWPVMIVMLALFFLLAFVPPDFNDTTKKG